MQVTVLMGSDSDWLIAKDACETLKKFGVAFEAHALSAHRSPIDLLNYVKHCEEMGCKVFICIAGRAAHLGGTVAAHTSQPVIGVPVGSNVLFGLDSVLSTVQMPPGVPVATVAIDGGQNAAILAVQMLAISDEGLRAKIKEHKTNLVQGVRKKDQTIQDWVKAYV
jgi:5-(carboxyamino)imidazole ribonucleotide mutase